MIKFLFTVLVLYLAIRMTRQILFGPAVSARRPQQPPFQARESRPRQGRLDQIEDAEFTEIDPR